MIRSLSPQEFEYLKRNVHIFIVTAVDVEEDAVNEALGEWPFGEDIIPYYNNEYRFGYFGEFLAVHRMCGPAGNNAAIGVTRALSELCPSGIAHSFYVLMPGIACGLKRSKYDETIISRDELRKYLPASGSSSLPKDIENRLRQSLAPKTDRINLPSFMTPESENTVCTQRIGDILFATSLKQHDHTGHKADATEDRGQLFVASANRLKLLPQYISHWQATAPEAKYGDRTVQVYLGSIICGDKLINDYVTREQLRKRYEDAIGVEMEGHGLGAAVHEYSKKEQGGQAGFLFAKGISDWGVGKADDWRERAAKASVSLLRHCLANRYFFPTTLIPPVDKEKFAADFAAIHPSGPVHSVAQPLKQTLPVEYSGIANSTDLNRIEILLSKSSMPESERLERYRHWFDHLSHNQDERNDAPNPNADLPAMLHELNDYSSDANHFPLFDFVEAVALETCNNTPTEVAARVKIQGIMNGIAMSQLPSLDDIKKFRKKLEEKVNSLHSKLDHDKSVSDPPNVCSGVPSEPWNGPVIMIWFHRPSKSESKYKLYIFHRQAETANQPPLDTMYYDGNDKEPATIDSLKDTLKSKLGKLLMQAKYKNALVEFFLPLDQLGQEVDTWEYAKTYTGKDVPYQIGIDYPVVVRSAERQDPKEEMDSESLDNWRRRWNYFCTMKDSNDAEAWLCWLKFAEVRHMQAHLREKADASCFALEFEPETTTDDFFHACLQEGMPIMIWARKSARPKAVVESLVCKCHKCHRTQLLQRISLVRAKIEKERLKESPKESPVLLWDNPTRALPVPLCIAL